MLEQRSAGILPASRPQAGIDTGKIAAVPAACRLEAGVPRQS
jgi:hypothetical protein